MKLALEAWDTAHPAGLSFDRDDFEEAVRERMAQAAQLIAELKEHSATDCPNCPKCGLPILPAIDEVRNDASAAGVVYDGAAVRRAILAGDDE
jgi:hypothetical protein